MFLKAGYTLLTVALFIVALIVATQYIAYLGASGSSGNIPVASNDNTVEMFDNEMNVGGAEEDVEDNANHMPVAPENGADKTDGCFPRDSLSSADLLPRDANSKWSMNVPSGTGSILDGSFLSAGALAGDDTVGSSLRNPSYDLRGDPVANPQNVVSPWQQSSILPDLSRKSLQ